MRNSYVLRLYNKYVYVNEPPEGEQNLVRYIGGSPALSRVVIFVHGGVWCGVPERSSDQTESTSLRVRDTVTVERGSFFRLLSWCWFLIPCFGVRTEWSSLLLYWDCSGRGCDLLIETAENHGGWSTGGKFWTLTCGNLHNHRWALGFIYNS